MWNWIKPLGGEPSPQPVTRSAEQQAELEQACDHLALYHFIGCPFCSRVTRAIEQLALPIELRDIHAQPHWRTELVQGGGRKTVPCLRIEHPDGQIQWLYESMDIIAYLQQRFAGAQGV